MSVEIEKTTPINPTPCDPAPSPPPLVLSSSSKTMDRRGSMSKYVRQVTGRHNDTELHVAARQGDVMAVRMILEGMRDQAEREDVAEIQSLVSSEVNEVGDTPLIVAAEKGFVEVVVELVKYLDRDGVVVKNRCGYDAFHVAVREGHRETLRSELRRYHTLGFNRLRFLPSLILLSAREGRTEREDIVSE